MKASRQLLGTKHIYINISKITARAYLQYRQIYWSGTVKPIKLDPVKTLITKVIRVRRLIIIIEQRYNIRQDSQLKEFQLEVKAIMNTHSRLLIKGEKTFQKHPKHQIHVGEETFWETIIVLWGLVTALWKLMPVFLQNCSPNRLQIQASLIIIKVK